jgi:hypothetical protein
MKQQTNDVLNPNRFITRIRTSNEFLGALPKTDLRELDQDKREHALHRAIAASALSLAEHEKKESGHDLDANLFEMVSGLQGFYESSRTLDTLRDRYGSPKNMPPAEKDRFYDSKDTIIEFNDTLVEVINSGASQFDFGELLTFMTNIFSASNSFGDQHASRHRTADFNARARESLVGMRNEMAVEQLLIAGGVEFRRGTVEEDSKGGDYFIEDVPIDFKSDEYSAQRARMRTEENGYDGSGIVWSHVNFEDFEGKLMLPYEKCVTIFAKLKPDLDAAIAAHQRAQVAHAI